MASYPYDTSSSSSAPPPPYSISASASASGPGFGFGGNGSASSSLHPPSPAIAYGTSSTAGASDYGILDSKWRLADPRSSSAQSLAPSVTDRPGDNRRTLLIIYIHGFYGNESSFRSFPAHVHNYLKEALIESHVVHSKIYPRYKTYKAIDVARDNFSQWLEPHESETTDVVLVGHSMGGLLAAEVALMPNQHPYRRQPFKHRILGTVSLDSPFLGLHPGIVVAGISSLFRPASPPPDEGHDQHEGSLSYLSPTNSALSSPDPSMSNLELSSSLDAELSPSNSNTPSFSSSSVPPSKPDPFFNPPFFNDMNLKDRPFMKRLAHFAKKHSAEGIWDATKNHVMSHLEFGGCLADYPGLKARYNKLRALEDVDPLQHLRGDNNSGKNMHQPSPVRVRFVNYYTLSTGRVKKPKSPSPPDSNFASRSALDVSSQLSPHPPSTPTISVQNSDGSGELEILEPMQMLEPIEAVDSKLSPLQEKEQAQFNDGPCEASLPDSCGNDSVTTKDQPGSKGKEKEKPTEGADSSSPAEDNPNIIAGEANSRETAAGGGATEDAELPPIPEVPQQPAPPDLDRYTDKDARKQAEKEAKRAQKAYEQAVKSRDKAIKERQKLVEKRRRRAEKEALKESQRLEKEEQRLEREAQRLEKEDDRMRQEAERMRQEAERMRHADEERTRQAEEAARRREVEDDHKRQQAEAEAEAQMAAVAAAAAEASPAPGVTSTPPALPPRANATTQNGFAARSTAHEPKPKKERKFCTLPGKVNGQRDETWVPVFMEGMDEVGAHCGLFFQGPQYDKLIGEVSERIIGWVQDDLSVRAILEMS
ncbi:Stress response protein nst1-like protein 2 [Colletotrichum chlorophyti]|uniref:Stress response protein nst1-like protein 2 n=1 Tax=Colletotrichum chlorophyti TaxID=708187 RepID=A0A1Q8RKZ5_9PEZI|nr:Stress response protein nst1-like protein 2 [Colletotrichum chlorophyti]